MLSCELCGGDAQLHLSPLSMSKQFSDKKKFCASIEGRELRCAEVGKLKTRKRTHTSEKPYACTFEARNRE